MYRRNVTSIVSHKSYRRFQTLCPAERWQLVMSYMHRGDHFKDITFVDRSPEGADPLWIVRGTVY
ncbi:MAG: hypothetical protein ACJAYE_003011 [Candidatus Azotimanducaceae bacterium]|jgi:hypothetical protein